MPKESTDDGSEGFDRRATAEAARPFWSWLRDVSPAQWVTLLALMAVALVVRLRLLDIPMRYDESFTVWRYAMNPLRDVVADYSLPNNHVFHTVLVHATILLGGIEPWVVRLPALGAGILIVPASFLAFSRLAGTTCGLLTAGLTALSPALIDYSVNARGYTMAGGLALAGLLLAFEVRRRPTRVWLWFAMAVVGALGLWTIPVFVYPWAVLLFWLIARGNSRHRLKERLIGAGAVGLSSVAMATLLYIPVFNRSGVAALTSNRFVEPLGVSEFVGGLPDLVSGLGRMWTSNVSWLLVVPLAAGVLAALFLRTNVEVRALAWSCLAGMVGVMLLSRALPPVRTLLVVLPLVIGIAAAGLTELLTVVRPAAFRMTTGAVVLVGVGLTLVTVLAADNRPLSEDVNEFWDAEQVAVDLGPLVDKDSSVLAYGTPTSPLRYYFNLHGLPRRALGSKDPGTGPIFVVVETGQSLQKVIDENGVSDWVDASAAVELEEYETGSLWLVPEIDPNT